MHSHGIRAWELTRRLAHTHDVTLALPHATDLTAETFRIMPYTPDTVDDALLDALERAEVVVVQGHVTERYPHLLDVGVPIAVDLCDPLMMRTRAMVPSHDRAVSQAQFEQDIAIGDAQLRRGDFFICANDRQRDYWLGALTEIGRVTPELLSHSDRDLRDLIDLVPSGVPEVPIGVHQPILRGVHPAIRQGDTVLLWFGGLGDWLEPELLVRAMAQLSIERPRLKLMFVTGPGAGPAPRSRTATRARAVASELEVLDRSVLFLDEPIAYQQRAAYVAEADIGVSAHRSGIETRFASRVRLLDYVWAHLPVITSSGDPLSDELAAAGAALLVQPGDLGGWVAALRTLSDDAAQRERAGAAMAQLAQRMTWDTLARPLVRFCERPRRAPTPVGGPYEQILALRRALIDRDSYVRHLETEYHQAVTRAQQIERRQRPRPGQAVRRAAAWIVKRARDIRQRRRT